MPVGGWELAALLTLAAILGMLLDGHAPQVPTARASVDAAHVTRGDSAPPHHALASGAGRPSDCPMTYTSTGYRNPLAGATVKPERIDQGVDYAGSGTLAAISTARISHVATDNTGWPGAFIEYQLLAGPDAGCFVFYAEGVTPAPRLRVGEIVAAGQAIAKIIPLYPTGFELGWSAGTGTTTYAGATKGWTADDDQANLASGPGRKFSALIAALGGPPGKVEG